jgi:hypothetical protein
LAILAGSLLTHCTALIGLGDEPTLETDASNGASGGSATAGAAGSQTGGRGGSGGASVDASIDAASGSGGTAGRGGAAGSGGAGGSIVGDGGCPTCNMPCTADAMCGAAAWCDLSRTPSVCVPKKPVGQACTGNNNNQCADAHCVDGYCCDNACTGQCEACNIGTPGTCAQVIGAPHPGKTACGGTGMCAASCSASRTMCTFPTTQCRPPTCMSNQAVQGASCDGAGTCPAPMTTTCANGCNAAGTACNMPCASDTNCPTGSYCDTTAGQCQPKKANGQKCGGDNQCTNAHCVDTYCCNAACTGQCEACDVPTVEGTCSQVNGAPRNGRTACAGTTPCTGTCSASRTACTFGTGQCRSQTCAGGTITNAAQCNMGSCPGVTTTSCNNFTCMGAGCTGVCNTSNDTGCLSGFFCNGGNQCLSTMPNGRSCAGSGSTCTSGNCVDSYCCNTACSGGCDVCNATPGTCTVLSAGATGVGCGNYYCQGAAGGACPTTCTTNAQCVSPTACNGGACTCFVAGTPVETEEGLRPIETVQPGMRVRSFDTATGESSFRTVKQLEKRMAHALVSVHVDGAVPIRASPEHYFWVKGSGWVRAAELTMDDRLISQGREARQVTALETLSVPECGVPVYNLVVEGFNDYFVGDTPVLVHSCDYMNYSAVARERLPE